MKTITYSPKGICSQSIIIGYENDIVLSLELVGGCQGNHKAISSLIIGMKINDVIEKLKGIECGFRKTSCGDQIAIALETIK